MLEHKSSSRLRGALLVTAVSAGLVLTAGGAAASMGGGGGGGMGGFGGGMGPPSASAPSYNPAEEYREGVEALKAEKYREAVEHLERVSDAAPRNADVWFLLGLAKAGKGDLRGAQRAFDRCLKLDPDRIVAHQERGVVLAKLKQTDKAQADLGWLKTRAATCGDGCADADALKAAVAKVDAALAQPAAPTAALSRPSPLFADAAAGDRAYVHAIGLINDKHYAQALSSLEQSMHAFGPHPDILTAIGYTHRKMGHLDEAERYYREALAIAPDHRGATEYYGELKVVQGDIPAAKALLAKLENSCAFGCAETEELRRWIAAGRDPSAS
jgi:tetratricopeptide (TPR) repeat protein